jgi:hypothetical protein
MFWFANKSVKTISGTTADAALCLSITAVKLRVIKTLMSKVFLTHLNLLSLK